MADSPVDRPARASSWSAPVSRPGRGLRACPARLQPIVLEADAEVGGLAATFQSMERASSASITTGSQAIIHHRARARARTRRSDRLQATRTGMYFANSSIACRPRSMCCGFRSCRSPTGCGSASRSSRATRRDWREIDHISAAEWLRKLGGEGAFRVVWEPLLRGKFGPHADDVSAAWFWSKLRLRGGSRGARGEERLAYFRGGFAALADELVAASWSAAERCA